MPSATAARLVGVVQVHLDRRETEVEPLGDLRGREAVGEQRKDLVLTGGQLAPRAASLVDGHSGDCRSATRLTSHFSQVCLAAQGRREDIAGVVSSGTRRVESGGTPPGSSGSCPSIVAHGLAIKATSTSASTPIPATA